MITTKNYFSEIERIGADTLPVTLRKSHDFILLTTANGTTWDTYNGNETVKKMVDLYFTKLDGYLSTRQENSPRQEPVKKQVPPHPGGKKGVKKINTRSAGPKMPHATRAQKPIKRVEHFREEIKFIKRYVGLHNRVKSPNAILSFIKALQRSIVQKLIRKTSPMAKEIETIQDKLVNAYTKMKGDENFTINGKDLGKFVAIAGGEEVYPSVKFIKRFVGMQGKELTANQVGSFLKQLENAVAKKKLNRDDPYADKLSAIYKKLKTTPGKISLTRAELHGLEGIVKACGCKPSLGKIYHTGGKKLRPCNKRATYTDATRRGACSHNYGLNGILSAEEMANRKFDMLDFIEPWKSLVGMPAKNFTMMLHGEPNAGKTTLLLKFAKYLADNFGKVMYISSEEYAATTMSTKVKELLNPFPPGLFFYSSLSGVNLSHYDFIILDSVNDLGLKLLEFKALRKDHPNTAFILILQHTKDGQYRGGKDWEHEVEIAGKVENGVLAIYRNRYGVKGTMDFFNPSNGLAATPRPYSLNNTIL